MKFILKSALNEGIYIVFVVGKHAILLSKQLLKQRQRQLYQQISISILNFRNFLE